MARRAARRPRAGFRPEGARRRLRGARALLSAGRRGRLRRRRGIKEDAMTTYSAPVKDMRFILDEVLKVDRFDNLPGFSDAPKDVRDAILDEGAKFCEGELQPLNKVGDREGCTRSADGSVKTPTGYKEAYDKFVAAGFTGLSADPE